MNARMGQPAGTVGTITFDASDLHVGTRRTLRAVRDEAGQYWTNVKGALWLPANVRDDQFQAA